MVNKNRNRSYSNGEITIFWQGDKCTHSTLCYNRLRSVFDPIRRPWINPNGAPTAEILAIIEECPSDALTFRWVDESRNAAETSKKLFAGNVEQMFAKQQINLTTLAAVENQQIAPPVKVDLRANGPIVVSGNFEVIDSNGITMKKIEMISLCRCGASANMPYCDGTHFKIGFRA